MSSFIRAPRNLVESKKVPAGIDVVLGACHACPLNGPEGVILISPVGIPSSGLTTLRDTDFLIAGLVIRYKTLGSKVGAAISSSHMNEVFNIVRYC